MEDLAGELEQAVSRNQVKSTFAMVKRYAPVQAPPKVTVRQKDGSSTWGHDGEIAARRGALVTIFGAKPLSLEAEPQLSQAKKWILRETLVTHKAGDVQWATAQLSNGKAGPCNRSGGPADKTSLEEVTLPSELIVRDEPRLDTIARSPLGLTPPCSP